MRLRAHSSSPANDGDSGLVVACPQRLDPVSITECAQCELCLGLELDSGAFVRCGVAASDPRPGESAARLPALAIMTGEVVTVPEDEAVENVATLMLERRIGAVPVVDGRGRPVGILTKTDLLRDDGDGPVTVMPRGPDVPMEPGSLDLRPSGVVARDRMTPVLHTCAARTSVARVATIMAKEGVHHVVVVANDGSIAGVVSTLDVVRWVAAQERFLPGTLTPQRR